MTDSRMGARWCRKEDEDLAELALDLNFNWNIIAQNFDKRSPQMCENRWNQVLSQGLIKGKWSVEEDSIIIESMKAGLSKWSEIAKRLPGNRVGKQCRERWCNHLDPTLKKTPWTAEEDAIMFQEQRNIGNSWTKIALQLPGRSENEVKNRFNSTARKRKLANRRLGYDGSIEENSDEEAQEEYQQSIINKKKRYTTAPQKPSKLLKPSVPDGYMIISMSKSDIRALQTAERLLNNLVPTDDPSCPFFINQLMSLLLITPTSDLSVITSSLNMVPIANSVDYDIPIQSNTTKNEATDYDIQSIQPLRVETNRDYRLNREASLNQTVYRKSNQNIIKEMEAKNSSLWLPQQQVSRKVEGVKDVSRQPTSTTSSSLPSSLPTMSSTPSSMTPGISSTSFLRITADSIKFPEILSTSPPSDFEEDGRGISQSTSYSSFPQFNEYSAEEIGNGDGHIIGLKEEGEITIGLKEEGEISSRSSPFMFLEGLTQAGSPSSPNWDKLFPTMTSPSSPIQFGNCISIPDASASLGEKHLFQGPQKKRKWVRSTRSLLNDQNSRILSSSPTTTEIEDDENSIVVVALQMLSGSSREDIRRQSETRISETRTSPAESMYNFSEISNGGMSLYSLTSTPWHSQPQTPWEDDPIDGDDIDNLKSVMTTCSLLSSSSKLNSNESITKALNDV